MDVCGEAMIRFERLGAFLVSGLHQVFIEHFMLRICEETSAYVTEVVDLN